MAVVREARPGDFDAVLRLYLQLNLDDPRPDPEAASAQFEQSSWPQPCRWRGTPVATKRC